MKKALVVLAIAAVMTFTMTAVAFADHSPTFYVQWDKTSSFTGYVAPFGNAGTGSPHQNYLEGTEKCAVCHSVHRAPVYGAAWSTAQSGATTVAAGALTPGASYTNVAGGQYKRGEFDNTANGLMAYSQTQMLLQSSVSNSCDYCHIITSIGGDQLYAGKPQYRTEGTGLAGAEWDAGFAHHNGCTGCHAVHGVSANYGNAALWGAYGTFQGPIKSKVLKVRAKGSGGAVGSLAAYNWQDETVVIGSAGKAEYAASGIAGAAAWAGAQTANDALVDPLNVPLFPSETDAINGTNVRSDANAYDAQSGVFCTFCHVNYGYASEATVNPDGDRGLFQGPWFFLAGATNPGVAGAAGSWYTGNAAQGYGTAFKNHPVKAAYGNFAAAGKGATVPNVVAFANASTCVSCHDAGLNRPVDSATGVFIESYPHFTPGYFHFSKSAAKQGDTMVNGPVEAGLIPDVVAPGDSATLAAVQAWLEDPANYEDSTTVQDGQCLKCHVNAAGTAGVGITF